ncbi:MAG TPA: CPBP family intramembrane glutamic endopeptidase [Candidatus Angelobacter sp.]|nr:CPBP family intramembrane glutamic endopeptidase [Candidatus Angelobacter sp.]
MNSEAPSRQPEIASPEAGDALARELRGFGPLGLLAILIILAGNIVVPPMSAVLALIWARRSHTPWREIGYVRPKNWVATVAIGLAFGIVFKLVLKSAVMPLLGAPDINQTYHYLAGNRAAIPGTLWLLIAGAGFGEETIFRGYMFERLGKLFGSSLIAQTAIVLITTTLFALAHYSTQGWAGTEQGAITGFVFGSIFAFTGRIFMLMCAHAAFDLTAYALIYWGLETNVAHWLFR